MNKHTIKRLRAVGRDHRIENGVRSTETQTIPSRREKDTDPRRQRKSKSWEKEHIHAFL